MVDPNLTGAPERCIRLRAQTVAMKQKYHSNLQKDAQFIVVNVSKIIEPLDIKLKYLNEIICIFSCFYYF